MSPLVPFLHPSLERTGGFIDGICDVLCVCGCSLCVSVMHLQMNETLPRYQGLWHSVNLSNSGFW